MLTKTLIAEKLNGQHENFLKYCKAADKNFVEELTDEDFIEYRTEYFLPRSEVEQIKTLLDFQDERTPKKAPTVQESFYDFPLKKIFKLDGFLSDKDIFVVNMEFNGRLQKFLERNNIETLAQLADLSLQDLSNMRGFGKTSLDNLILVLKKFAASKKKKLPAKVLQLAKEELDEFLRDAAVRHAPQIDLIIRAFENFSAQILQKSSPLNVLAPKIRALPKSIKSKKLHLLLPLYDFKHSEIFDGLPDELTLSAFPQWLSINFKPFDENEMLNFFNALNIDLKTFAKNIAETPFQGKVRREFEIIRRRLRGGKLEEIGRDFGITRERVRQIELKFIKEFTKSHSNLEKLFYFLHALNDGKAVLTLADTKKFIDDDNAEIIWFFAAKMKLSNDVFSFDKETKAFIFYDKVNFDENEILKNIPKVMDEKTFEATVEALANEKNYSAEVLRFRLLRFYTHGGQMFYRESPTFGFKCRYILKEKFPMGYKIGSENSYSRLMSYVKEIFDDDGYYTQRHADATIGLAGVLCDRGKYIHPDFVHVPPQIMERVKNFIDNSDRTAIFYKEIYESLKNIFLGTQITNHYFLQGVIKFYKLPYTLRKDYLTKSDEIDMAKEFDNFVRERGEVTNREIKGRFISFETPNIGFLLLRCPEVIRISGGKYMHASRLSLRESDFDPIRNFLSQNCKTLVHTRILFVSFSKQFADFMTRNKIDTHYKLFGILRYMFHDEFNFAYPYISVLNVSSIANKKAMLHIFGDKEEVKIEELVAACAEKGVANKQKSYLMESLMPEYIRVDRDTLQRPETVGVTEEIISEVAEKICVLVDQNGGWLAVKAFNEYEKLPKLEIPWNSFLLESVVSLAGDVLYKLRIPSKDLTLSTAVFVSENFAEDDVKSFLIKILQAKHKAEPFHSEKHVLVWLQKRGLCDKKLPSFLAEGKVFEILNE